MSRESSGESLIVFDAVAVAFPTGGLALRNITTTIEAGTFVALVGGSGAGKTTLLKSVNRLIEPTHGTVSVEGRDVRAHEAATLRRRIGYVFQGLGLFPHMSVAENIGITPQLLGWSPEKIAARVRELLDLVDLPSDFAARMPAALSGGQRQRVAMARALAAHPPIMLLDEAFGALDPLTRDEVTRAYRAIHDQLRLTTIMVTHDVQEALLLADRIVVLADGLIVADGTALDLATMREPAEVAQLLDMPRRQAERIQGLLGAHGGPSHE
jgi:osmoprotectant transport system ATP-binding protein